MIDQRIAQCVDFCGHAMADPVGARFRNVEIPGMRVEGVDWRTEPDALVEVIIHTGRRFCRPFQNFIP